MTWSLPRFVSAVTLAVLAAPATASAQQELVPEGIAVQVRTLVAQEWEVEPESLVLEFGDPPKGGFPRGDAPVEVHLMGSGSGGHWIARLATSQADAGSMRVRAGVNVPVFVAAQALSRGQVLAQTDLDEAEEIRWGVPVRSEPLPQVGWVVQRLIRPGEPLRSPAVRAPLAVQSGRSVDLVWQRAGVGIRLRGRAAGSAPMGGQVFVRTESGERLTGVVVAPGVVDVTSGGVDG